MLHRPGVTPDLARLVVETRWGDVPEQIRHEAKRALLNFFAVALSGCRNGTMEIALQSLAEFSDRRQATVIGRGERMDALSAAFLNAAGANVLDFCDTHLPTAIHPTAPVAPALFGLSELRRVRGADLLLAFILGVEAQCRIGNVISPGHYTRGWHITSSCGVFGAAVGAGKLIGLDAARMVSALGIASTQSSGLCECLGWPAKSVSVGNAARNGLWSALLADKGFEGPAEPIAGVQGFVNAMGEPPNWPALTDGLGETWELAQNSIKPYPCGFVIHPVLDCVLDWLREHPAAAVERVVVRGSPLLVQRTDRPDISTGRESQVSVQHAVAAVLVRGRAGLDEFTDDCARDPDVVAMRRKVEVIRDGALSTVAAQVELSTKDGTKHALATSAARGSPANPMSDRDIEDKLRAIAEAWHPGHDVAPLIDAVWTLERSDDASTLLALTVPRP
ncbi:MAG TPA: MmgE/PrpD family protein [Xanthobacteraceae bacterium]|nr:MmgE/PrpD family protein [Xanthobacteraceae bacterium]